MQTPQGLIVLGPGLSRGERVLEKDKRGMLGYSAYTALAQWPMRGCGQVVLLENGIGMHAGMALRKGRNGVIAKE